ncbi:hypothetical protein SETIT_9G210600v2 [Setaria italica]|uniref:Uncharacterized protein n=1 Tax=Setaria italica TaxID=4555 RepID=A0A368SIZ6_SETIT|nr:hypothetical protein SETIT_9G210600v2 [Setaria italica]
MPRLWSSPRASQTAGDASTMLLSQGGSKLCSSSQPWTESHSSTTLAYTELPLAEILMRCPQRAMLLNHPVESATTFSSSLWYALSHSDGPPPSLPFSKLLSVSTALVLAVTGGEQRYCGYFLPSSQQSGSLLFSQLPDRPGRPAPGRRENAMWEVERATRTKIAMAAAALAETIFPSLKKEVLKLTLFFLFPVLCFA